MRVELKDRVTDKVYRGKELTYRNSTDKHGYVLLDDSVIFQKHPIYTPEELHEYFKEAFEIVYYQGE